MSNCEGGQRKAWKSQCCILKSMVQCCIKVDGAVVKESPIVDQEVSLHIQGGRDLDQDIILLDNQATISVFSNTSLLSNIRSATEICHINEIASSGESIIAKEIGDYNGFKNIYSCPDAAVNILSFSDTNKYCCNDYDKVNDTFLSTPPGDKTYRFVGDNGLYSYKLPSKSKATVLVNTVKSNLQLFSTRERQDAEKARELVSKLGYPSPSSVIDMINNGTIIECPVTAKDVARAYKIYSNYEGILLRN